MYRLADIISDERSEVRNSAFQTLLRIFKNHSVDFANPAWQLTIETLLYKVLRENAEKQRKLRFAKGSADTIVALDLTSSAIIGDIAALLVGQFDQMASFDSFDRLWSELMDIFQMHLDFHSSVVNAAVYSGLSTLLSAFNTDHPKLTQAISRAASLCSSSIPDCSADVKGQSTQQDAYLAYVDCGRNVYNLVEKNTTAEQITKLIRNMIDCVRSSSGAAYGSDIDTPTILQQRVLDHLKLLHGNVDLVSSALVDAASELVTLPFDAPQNPKPKTSLTFVALSKGSMEWLSELVTTSLAKPDMFLSGAVALALESLVIPMKLQYRWNQTGKVPATWQKATPVAIAIVEKTLKQMKELALAQDMKSRMWEAIINIAHAIMHADIEEASPQPTPETVEKDEVFDCQSMKKLMEMMTSDLNSPAIPDAIRQTYASSLFDASLIHAVERGDIPKDEQLSDLHNLRVGRVRDPEPSMREDMAYLCFSELLSLVTKSSENRVKLAQAAAPYLVLRLALPLKAYIVDQPLRGSMPQPLSQVEELLFCLDEMEKLRCEPEALGAVDGHSIEGQKMHLELLYPLMVKAVGVAGQRRYGNKKILNALQRVLDVSR